MVGLVSTPCTKPHSVPDDITRYKTVTSKRDGVLIIFMYTYSKRDARFVEYIMPYIRGRNSGSPVVQGLPETWSDYQR